jgi:hypothetical protein
VPSHTTNSTFVQLEKKTVPPVLKALSNETPFLIAFLCISFYAWLAPAVYSNYLSYVIVVWAAVLMLAKLLVHGPKFLKTSLFGIGLALAYVVTLALNLRHGHLMVQLRSLIWIGMFSIIVYGSALIREKLYHNTKALVTTFVILTFLASLVSLISYYTEWDYFMKLPDGTIALVGFFNQRLFGVYIDPNFGAMFATLSILASFAYYLFSKRKKVLFSIFAAVNLIVQYLFIGLSFSRTGLILFSFSAIYIAIAYFVRARRRPKVKRNAPRLIVRVVAQTLTVALLAVLLWKPVWTKEITMQVSSIIATAFTPTKSVQTNGEEVDEDDSGKGKKKGKDKDLTQAEVEREEQKKKAREETLRLFEQQERKDSSASSDERMALLKESFELWRHAKLFGHGDRNLEQVALELLPDSLMARGKVPHNSFALLLVAGGLVSTLIVLAWLIYIFIVWLRALIRTRFDLKTWMMALPVFVCLASGMALQDLFLTMSPSSLIFWFMLGATLCYSKSVQLVGTEAAVEQPVGGQPAATDGQPPVVENTTV